MTPEKWEGVCRRSGFMPLDPIRLANQGRILLAERYYIWDSEFKEPHWQVQWVIDRGGVQDGGRKLYFAAPSIIEPARQARINAAVADARQFMEDGIESGQYPS